MSSEKTFNRIQSHFPQGILLDTSGNCFNLFVEFPAKNGERAGVLIWEESVIVYNKNNQFLSKEEYCQLNKSLMAESQDETFKKHEQVILTSDDISWDDDDNEIIDPSPNSVFDHKTTMEIASTWRKFNGALTKG
ncbi:hypothetical protein BXO87_01885 [Bacillus sp. GZB]|uniref:hypothetical protein n=1 Tax=Bacillus TaxID=1386 RepID=UPI000975664F|nr:MULTISPECIES: hypothetical protein [Bacillus]MCZ4246878.1 hypothetical protein [Bacillus amyloliquefaciens]OMQ06780.1 hypothetical protein BXO87_01885 [Bacillus sp. GZB]